MELFYAGDGEVSAEAVQALEPLGVTLLDLYHHHVDTVGVSGGAFAHIPLRGWQAKAMAVQAASFEEILWLDCDCLPVQDPAPLFDSDEYRRTGSLFWPDLSVDPHWLTAGFLQRYGLDMREGDRELDAGQFVLHRLRCWAPLQVAVPFCAHLACWRH